MRFPAITLTDSGKLLFHQLQTRLAFFGSGDVRRKLLVIRKHLQEQSLDVGVSVMFCMPKRWMNCARRSAPSQKTNLTE